LSHIVEEVWQLWYQRAVQRRSNSPRSFIQEAFRPEDIPWALSHFKTSGIDNSVFDAKQALRYQECPLPSVTWSRFEDWANRNNPVEWQECVMHGDLHGGNIFLDPRSAETWLIDFARTGKRTSAFDLATLEAHIKFQLLPTLLRDKNLVEHDWEFIRAFREVEAALYQQPSYNMVPLVSVPKMRDSGARESLLEAMRTVTHIRILLHNSLTRSGSMLDYWIALLVQSFRYTVVRGGSDPNEGNMRLLCAALSVGELVDRLTSSGPRSSS
jgi:hypothetical protein